jgi:hypothetical protein
MIKLSVFFSLFYAFTAAAGSPLLIKKLIRFNADKTEKLISLSPTEFHKTYTTEYTSGELEFAIIANQHYLNSSDKIANYLWREFFPLATLEEPFPCGEYVNGTIKFISNPELTFTGIYGSGDGFMDTCTGYGGPGYWISQLEVYFNPTTQTGKVIYTGYIE